ncbi:MAG TPA: NAD(P)H-dependent oxidoreductase [Pusillimonas sp.]|uniref:flavodoxin family protein n=1 Tax=Pusillimonas sp. TaxID=3040095 RepID=UPI002CD791E2|nr:NAD(P)H-dependent oxidoreductase [Pusillimonas sp.]HUH87636.1 NAD(P)H-dependent oxidoreductase [Pusillimonas sp.]
MDDTTRRKLIIVWHSRTGTACQMACAAQSGALDIARQLNAEGRFQALLSGAAQTTAQDLLDADGFIFCAPENLGSLSGEMKEFFDRCYYDVLDKLNGRPCVVLVAAGSDGHGAVRQTERICTGWRLELAAPPHIVLTHAQSPEAIAAPKEIGPQDRARCQELGGTMAALLL